MTYSMRVWDSGIVMFRVPQLSRAIIDLWMEDLMRLGHAWIDDEVVLLMVDMRGIGTGFTSPYLTARLQEVSQMTPATTSIRTAFVFDGGPAMALAIRFLQGLGVLLGEKRAFNDQSAAEEWLLQML